MAIRSKRASKGQCYTTVYDHNLRLQQNKLACFEKVLLHLTALRQELRM
jgi:hypothetical protein